MNVFIYGATGFTGGMIAQALKERGDTVVIAGRDRTRVTRAAAALGDVESHAVGVHDPVALRDAMTGCDVVVSCAGPFAVVGEPVLSAAIEVGAHYLDTTGEQQFMRHMYERYESRARHAEVTVVNALAFEVAIGDWAAALAGRGLREDDIDEISIYYGVEGFRPSKGTRLSAIESMGRAGYVWNFDRWESAVPGAETRMVSFGPPLGDRTTISFPSGEIVTVPRHTRAHRVQSYVSLFGNSPMQRGFARMTAVLGPVMPLVMASPLGMFARTGAGMGQAAPTPGDRRDNLFTVIAEARSGFHRERVAVSGRDIYGVTVETMTMGIEALNRGDVPAGVLAPSELLEPEAAIDSLAKRCSLTVEKSFT